MSYDIIYYRVLFDSYFQLSPVTVTVLSHLTSIADINGIIRQASKQASKQARVSRKSSFLLSYSLREREGES
jgi:hypothetical protein